MQVLIDAIELVWRGSQRSDHVKKAINYVKILLDKQADPNARDEGGSGSAIHYAIWCGHLEVVKALLDTTTCNVEADTGQHECLPTHLRFETSLMHYTTLSVLQTTTSRHKVQFNTCQ